MNLEWVTSSYNNIHAFKLGLNYSGEESPKAIISEKQAIQVCEYLDEGKLSYSEIAKLCNIVSLDASSLISAIRRGVSWRSVSKNYNFAKNYKSQPRYKINKD